MHMDMDMEQGITAAVSAIITAEVMLHIHIQAVSAHMRVQGRSTTTAEDIRLGEQEHN